jgi:hypothetical protein
MAKANHVVEEDLLHLWVQICTAVSYRHKPDIRAST